MIQMLRKESCYGSIEDLAHVRTEVCMSDCLTKQSAKPDTLIRAVRTGVIPGVDTSPPFRSTLKHRAFVMNFLVETLGYSSLDAVHCQFFGSDIDSYPDQETQETGENCVCNSSVSFAATDCQYFDLETDDCQYFRPRNRQRGPRRSHSVAMVPSFSSLLRDGHRSTLAQTLSHPDRRWHKTLRQQAHKEVVRLPLRRRLAEPRLRPVQHQRYLAAPRLWSVLTWKNLAELR